MPNGYEAKVAPQVAPSVDIPLAFTPQAMGAGVGQAVQNLGDTAHQIYLRSQEHANQTAVLEADTRKQQFLNQRLYDPEKGLFHQNLGKDAPAAVDALIAENDRDSSEIESGLTNEVQKQAFRDASTARRLDLQRQLGSYEHGQLEIHAKQVDQTAIATAGTAALHAANSGDHEGAFVQIMTQQAVIAQAGNRNHVDHDTIKQQQADAASGTILGIIQQLATSDQPDAARAWFDENQKDLQGEDLTRATAIVRASSHAQASRDIADELVKGDDGQVVDRTTANARMESDPRLLKNAALRASVRSLVNETIDDHQRAKSESDGAAVNQAWQILTDPDNTAGASNPAYATIKASLPMDRQEQLDRAERKDVPEFSEDVAYLQRLVGTEAFMHVDLTRYRGRVRDAQLNHFQEVQVEQRNKGAKAPKVVEAVTQERIVSNGIADLRLDGDKPENSDEAMAYRRKFDLAKDAALATNDGKPLTEDDLSGIAKRLAADYVVASPRAAYSPLRWLGGGPTFQDDKGQLYKQSPETILRNVPIPGTVRLSTGEGMTASGVDDWVKVLANPKSPSFQAAQEQLRKMRAGIADDGSVDPAIAARYQVIQAAYAATLTTATKP